MNDVHAQLMTVLVRLPTDYTDYGGEVERWKDGDDYPDCSCGCKYFIPLDGDFGWDWGVCANVSAPRAGLLTFEHQTGRGCFEYDCTVDINSYDATIQEMVDEWKWDNN